MRLRALVLTLGSAGAAGCLVGVDWDSFTARGALADGGPGATDGALVDGDPGAEAGLDGGRDGEAGGATCPPWTLPETCDSRYLSDPQNCCIAGRDCQGGACTNGHCQAVTVVSDATNDARGIAVAGDKLVWATGCANRLRVVGKDGTNNLALPQGTHCTPSIAVGPDLTLTYWTEYNGPYLYATPVDGTGAPRIVATLSKAAQNNFGRVVVDATTAYFAIQSPPGVYFATAGGLGQAPHVVAGEASGESAGSPFGIAVSRTHLYWSDTAGGVIKRRALDGLGESRAAEIVASEAGPRDITLDAERIYWLTAGGDVRAKALDGSGTVSVLQSGQTAAESIVVDDTYVYFTRYASGAPVSRVPKIGGKVEVLAGQQRFPYGLAQDCTTIYWTEQANFGTGALRKVTK